MSARSGLRPPAELIGLPALLLAWTAAARLGWLPEAVPSPQAVAESLWRGMQDGSLAPALWVTVRRIVFGFALALSTGSLSGLLLSQVEALGRALRPLVIGLQAMPSVTWFPLAVFWFGPSEAGIQFVTVIGAFFCTVAVVDQAVRRVPPIYLRAARTMGARGWRLVARVALPAAMPAVVAGVRQSWTFAWRSLVGAELLFATLGLGELMADARQAADAGRIVGLLLVILLFSLSVERCVFEPLERAVAERWGLAPPSA